MADQKREEFVDTDPSTIEQELLDDQFNKINTFALSIQGASKPDFRIYCTDGYIEAYRCVLAASCDYLYQKIINLQNSKNLVKFSGCVSVMEVIINYLHGINFVSNSLNQFEHVLEVVWISNAWQLPDPWIRYCYSLLTQNQFLNTTTFFYVWDLIGLLGEKVSTEAIEGFARINVMIILTKQQLKHFNEERMRSLLQLADRDKHSDLIAGAIKIWRSGDFINRAMKLEDF